VAFRREVAALLIRLPMVVVPADKVLHRLFVVVGVRRRGVMDLSPSLINTWAGIVRRRLIVGRLLGRLGLGVVAAAVIVTTPGVSGVDMRRLLMQVIKISHAGFVVTTQLTQSVLMLKPRQQQRQ
jgi:hypothetical protein